MHSKNIAIIGGGVAGLTAGYLLHDSHHVTLLEKTHRIGGNAYTYTTADGQDLDIAVAAFGMAGYHNFYNLLDELGVETDLSPSSYMSFHDLDTEQGLYITPTLKGTQSQHFNLFRPRTLKILWRLFSGIKKAQALLDQGVLAGRSMGECLARVPQFKRGGPRTILLSTLCLLSSMNAEEVLSTPAHFFLNKLRVHNDVISPRAVYSVRTVKGGTQSYVNALSAGFRSRIKLNAQIEAVTRLEGKVQITLAGEAAQQFDSVIFACPADTALALLAKPTARERELLGVWHYKHGKIVVHRDHAAFPARELIQAYTFLYTDRNGRFNTSVNGALWHEPQVSDSCDYISTQHPNFPIREELVELETTLATPIFSQASSATIRHLPSLNGVNNTFYCGSHFGFGLHNDAVSSAITVAQHFGINRDTQPRRSKYRSGIKLFVDTLKQLRNSA